MRSRGPLLHGSCLASEILGVYSRLSDKRTGERPAPRAVRSERHGQSEPSPLAAGLLAGIHDVRPPAPSVQGGGLTVSSLPLGGDPDAKVRRTVAAMRAVVMESLRDPAIVERAAAIVRNVDGRDKLGQIRALRAWLASNVRFLPDPLIDGDVIRTPALLLRQFDRDGVIRGDCDDVATLTATLGHAVGIAARFVTLGFNGPAAPFQHVFCELADDAGGWHQMDVTETAATRAAQKPTRREVYEVLGPGVTPSLAGLLTFVQGAYLVVQAVQQIQRAWDDLMGDVDDV